MSEHLTPKESDLFEQRGQLLAEFAEHPEDDDVWNTAYEWVRSEGDAHDFPRPEAGIDGIPAEELIRFAQTVRATDPNQRYDLTVEQAPNGQPWFDVLETFSSPQLQRAKLTVMQALLGQSDYEFEEALDIGTGTGKSLGALEAVANHVTGLDRNASMLKAAATRKGPYTDLVQASVELLPFPDNSFDLIASSGLTGSLDKETAVKFYGQIARVLQPGGAYIDGSYYPNEQGYSGQALAAIQHSSKAMLADMIVDTISGKLNILAHLEFDDRQALLARLGLTEVIYGIEDELAADGTMSAIHAITNLQH